MARWYSKRRKKRYTLDLQTRGCIPNYGHIMFGMSARNAVVGLERCEFDDECEYCDNPKGGSYVSMAYYGGSAEIEFLICRKCAIKNYYREYLFNQSIAAIYSNFQRWKWMQNLKDGQAICAWCDDVYTDECTCGGFQYNKRKQQCNTN